MKHLFHTGFLCLFLIGFTSFEPAFAQNGMLILMDQSGSVSSGKISQPVQSKIKSLLHEHLRDEGDVVTFTFLFNNSASAHNRKTYTLTYPKLGKGAKASNSKLKEISSRGTKNRIRKGLIEKILQDVGSINTAAARKSEILEGLVQVPRIASKTSSLKIVFFSDMIENSSIRQFILARSMNDAAQWSKADVATLKSKYLLPDKLYRNAQISCFYPNSLQDDGRLGLRFIESYWRAILNSLFVNPHIEFQTL